MCADLAPYALSFFYRVFKEGKKIELEQEGLLAQLRDFQEDVEGQEVKSRIYGKNLVNLHTLPAQENTLAIHGSGFAVLRIASAAWLQHLPVYYWGDIDAQGFEILSDLRSKLPSVKSVCMDAKAIKMLSR